MHEPLASKPRNLASTITIAVDEMFEALQESIAGLNDDQVWSHPIERRHSIGMIVLHVQENVDQHACYVQVGHRALEHDARFAMYGRPVEELMHLEDVPGVDELRRRNETLREAVFEILQATHDRELYSPRYGEQTYWWQEHRRLSIDAYHRIVWHANAHVRQIWCLRGAMGAFDGAHFPRQFWH
jgi:hypothetical protein